MIVFASSFFCNHLIQELERSLLPGRSGQTLQHSLSLWIGVNFLNKVMLALFVATVSTDTAVFVNTLPI